MSTSLRSSTTKTKRFAEVVKACGAPLAKILWTKPEDDAGFMAAVKQNRVMTLKEADAGSKRDFGFVGFDPGKGSRYLVFPKRLDAFRDSRVIGIKYELLETAAPVGSIVKTGPEPRKRVVARPTARTAAKKPAAAPKPPKLRAGPSAGKQEEPKPKPKPLAKFRVTLRFTATTEVTQDVEAENAREAPSKAEAAASTPDFARASITRKVVNVQRTDGAKEDQ